MSCYFLNGSTPDLRTSLSIKAPLKDYGAKTMVISSPVRPLIASNEEHTKLKRSSDDIVPDDTPDVHSNTMELYAANG